MMEATSYVDTFRPLMELRQSRLRRIRPLPVIDHARFGGPTRTGFGTPGSLILFMARSPEHTKEAMAALKSGKAAMKKLIRRISDQMDQLRPGGLDQVIRSLAQQPVVASLTYAGAPILDPIWLPQGLDMTAIAIPYSGGRLLREGFQFVEYVEREDSPGYSSFVLKSTPRLTPAERVALAKVPKHHHSVHVGNGYNCELTTIGAAAFGVAGALGGVEVGAVAGGPFGAIVGGAVGAVGGAVVGGLIDVALVAIVEGKRFGHRLHLDPEDIKKLGPSESAKQLVNKRRDAMKKAHAARRKKHA
jgi:hypothetical protein